MKDLTSNSPLQSSEKHLANHSTRKTLVKKFKQQQVPKSETISITGHNQEMKILGTVFRDFGKNMVGKRYFQHYTEPVITGKNSEKSGLVIIKNSISIFGHL